VTGYRSQHFRYDCSTGGCYVANLPSWDDMLACFPRGIRPTDVDGMVEINGHVLILEEKQAGVALQHGQGQAFRTLARMGATVMVFRPRPDGRVDLLTMTPQSGPDGWQPVGRDEFHARVRGWVTAADAAPHVLPARAPRMHDGPANHVPDRQAAGQIPTGATAR
jgi:hypothetical protein